MAHRSRTLSICLVAAALVLSGCGGVRPASTGPPEPAATPEPAASPDRDDDADDPSPVEAGADHDKAPDDTETASDDAEAEEPAEASALSPDDPVPPRRTTGLREACRGDSLDARRVFGLCRGRRGSPGSPSALRFTVAPDPLPPLRSGDEIELIITLENVSDAPQVVVLMLSQEMMARRQHLEERIDSACRSPSYDPRREAALLPYTVEILPGGSVTWRRRVRAWVLVVEADRERLARERAQGRIVDRSGALCRGRPEDVARGDYPIIIRSPVPGIDDLPLTLVVR